MLPTLVYTSLREGWDQTKKNERYFRSLLWRPRDPWGLPASRGLWGPERPIGSPVLWPATKLGVVINCSVDSFTRFLSDFEFPEPKEYEFPEPKEYEFPEPKEHEFPKPKKYEV
jgi:hypothetical protein